MNDSLRLGAHLQDGGVRFALWTDRDVPVSLRLFTGGGQRDLPMENLGRGVYSLFVPGASQGTRYQFLLDGTALFDPYSRLAPQGVGGPSQVWESSYRFEHDRPQLSLQGASIYELHVGTFTPEGTLRAAAQQLPHLVRLGVRAIELMPLWAFPGERGWGYDGVYPFALHPAYGNPEDLQRLVDLAHGLGLGVFLDMVFNHFGPEGNVLWAYSPRYFTDRNPTPWGAGPDFTLPQLRSLMLESGEYWLQTFQFDGMRLDAVHAICDPSQPHFLEELASRVHALPGPRRYLIAEDERNLASLVEQTGLDGLWADDFHHQVEVLLTGIQRGYFGGYRPELSDLAVIAADGWLYQGQDWNGKPRGSSPQQLAPQSLVFCLQNHDQVGNRPLGDRLGGRCDPGDLRAATLLLLPYTPLLFMGQEWNARTPFLYFTDHPEPLGSQVKEGRRREFADFSELGGPEDVPDPQAEKTFSASKLDWQELQSPAAAEAFQLHQKLLRLRREDPVLRHGDRSGLRSGVEQGLLWVERVHGDQRRILLVNFQDRDLPWPAAAQGCQLLFATAQEIGGQVAAHSGLLLGGSRGQ